MSVPQTIQQVELLARKLYRQGVLADDGGALVVGQCVQARIRGSVLCGRLERCALADGEGAARFLVATNVGSVLVSRANVRSCESRVDGQCICVASGASRPEAGARRGRRVPPIGNTGGTR